MLKAIVRQIFGTANDRIIRNFYKTIDIINSLEDKLQALTDEELKNQTNIFKEKLASGAKIDDLLPEAFATVREASKRVLGLRHFDVQLLGGIILHKGMIAEMRTGEGKTLVATLPAYLNALEGKGVHVITVNDYLAKRDAASMGKLYNFLGLSVGCIIHGLTDEERKQAYLCDITHGTNNEFGFDYLRDNMKFSFDQLVQRPFSYAIVDEVDSILIDEARTPLIISGPTEDNSELYIKVDKIIPTLSEVDYEKDEKSRTVHLTEDGINKIESLLSENNLLKENANLYDLENINLLHHVNLALKAHKLFTKDVDYMVKNNKVMIIDEFTGRVMEGRRYSEGLHQALEAKEKVKIENENQTLASITFQNYFRLYPKLSGMTGTAMTEAAEFQDIYKLEVVEIPTNVPVKRIDEDDEIYGTGEEKFNAIVKKIEETHAIGQPILVGTVSIEKSEYISSLLKKKKIPHNVLNARYHEQEAYIIAQAGRYGAVTIATNMAGRGTDIMLGGNPELLKIENTKNLTDPVKIAEIEEKIARQVEDEKQKVLNAGGLLVIGSERHESRRIDNQLRGRSGRQGDPGKTKFYLSLEDDLMRIFASERVTMFLQKFGLKNGEPIYHPMLSKALEKAQKKVEERNYEIRKNLLKYDDVMNEQRKVIYEQRIELMQAENLSETVRDICSELIEEQVASHIPYKSYIEQWDVEGLTKEISHIFGLNLPINEWAKEEGIAEKEIQKRILEKVENLFITKEQSYGKKVINNIEQTYFLLTLDQLWKEHLHSLDHLRQGINLRAYGQRDPLNEYKKEAFLLFENLLVNLRITYIQRLAHLQISEYHEGQEKEVLNERYTKQKTQETRVDPALYDSNNTTVTATLNKSDSIKGPKIGRNDPCPCESGEKYKYCHGKLQ
jgi:preprotein translocase subunit SecA